ncbi:hypothetical protein [Novosphingobium sp.]|uniref:hypothetical protein n=1 Tax=Novosphingobium sp. TaxID=1874826 RepID=UPI0028A60AB0|nr:hypothetical protein [Novosphingobium sp.]
MSIIINFSGVAGKTQANVPSTPAKTESTCEGPNLRATFSLYVRLSRIKEKVTLDAFEDELVVGFAPSPKRSRNCQPLPASA